MEKTSEVDMGRLFKKICERSLHASSSKVFQTVDFHYFAWSPADKFFNVPTGHLSPLVATILGITILH